MSTPGRQPTRLRLAFVSQACQLRASLERPQAGFSQTFVLRLKTQSSKNAQEGVQITTAARRPSDGEQSHALLPGPERFIHRRRGHHPAHHQAMVGLVAHRKLSPTHLPRTATTQQEPAITKAERFRRVGRLITERIHAGPISTKKIVRE